MSLVLRSRCEKSGRKPLKKNLPVHLQYREQQPEKVHHHSIHLSHALCKWAHLQAAVWMFEQGKGCVCVCVCVCVRESVCSLACKCGSATKVNCTDTWGLSIYITYMSIWTIRTLGLVRFQSRMYNTVPSANL